MEKQLCTEFLAFWSEVIKLQSAEFSVTNFIPANVQNMSPLVFFAYFVSFMEKKPIKFYGVFDHFPWTYQVAKLWMIKLYFLEFLVNAILLCDEKG